MRLMGFLKWTFLWVLEQNVILYVMCYLMGNCLFSGVALRLASCGRSKSRGSRSTWWAARLLAPSWRRCTLRRRATVAWGPGLVSGPWCVDLKIGEHRWTKTFFTEIDKIRSCCYNTWFHASPVFIPDLSVHTFPPFVTCFLRIWPLTLRRSWIWPTLLPPCFLELPLTPALAPSSRANR